MPKGYYQRHPFSEEARKHMSEAHKGKHRPLCVIEKIRAHQPLLGKHLPDDRKVKQSLAMKGKPSGFKGKRHTSEAIVKNRINHLGKVFSAETRRKLSEKLKGNKRTLGLKHTSEAKRRISETHKGQNNVNWAGGISFEPYSPEFNRQLKELIRRRDGYVCQLCGLTEEMQGKRLTCHHIDYNKQHSLPSNLIALCHNCNNKVNRNRDKWTPYFYALLYQQGKIEIPKSEQLPNIKDWVEFEKWAFGNTGKPQSR